MPNKTNHPSPTKTVTCECGCPNFTIEVKTDLFGKENLDLSCVDCGAWRISAPTKTAIHQNCEIKTKHPINFC